MTARPVCRVIIANTPMMQEAKHLIVKRAVGKDSEACEEVEGETRRHPRDEQRWVPEDDQSAEGKIRKA